MKKLLLMVLFLILLTGCENNNDKLIMVTEAGFAPYEYYDNNNIVGVDIDIAQEIASYLGKELVIKDLAFDSLIEELNSGKADFAAAGMSITEERDEKVDFSSEYVENSQIVVVRKGYDEIKTVDDLKNKKISAQMGSIADLYVSKYYTDATLITQKKFLTAAQDVISGKTDCLIMDHLPAQQLVNKQNEKLEILNIVVMYDKYAIAVKNGNEELLSAINIVLDRLKREGKIKEFLLKHSL